MKTWLYFIIRLLKPVLNLYRTKIILKNLTRYPAFFKDWLVYRKVSSEKVVWQDLYPRLEDRGSQSQSGKSDYFLQDTWALRKIAQAKPTQHHDIASRIDGFVGQCSSFVKTVYVDIRKPNLELPNLEFVEGNLLKLPFADNSIASLSCLHVIEHVGLGRYGDGLNPQGSWQALLELQRVLAPGGNLYLAAPIGRERVMFNAHRILDAHNILKKLSQLSLVEFVALVPPYRKAAAIPIETWSDKQDAHGLFHFKK